MLKGGLKLKQEVAQRMPEKPSGDFTVAQIWVDAGVFHLDSPFSYLIPGDLAPHLHIGSYVSIPFHGREVVGCVIALENPDTFSGLKSITKVLGSIPLVSREVIELITAASRRYAAHPFDLLRSAIPDRVAKVESVFEYIDQAATVPADSNIRQYLQLPPAHNRANLIARKVQTLLQSGGVVVVLPDSREVLTLAKELDSLGIVASVLDSQLSKSEYYENFLAVRTGVSKVTIGTRSAIFAPVLNLRSILVYNEGSEHFYEKRSPGWNVRDIALLRAHHEKIDIYFAGYAPSGEVSRLIDQEWVSYKKSKAKVPVDVFSSTHGELLPSRSLTLIKRALTQGPVLFVVPTKGYAQAIRCAKCRTISRCECGGAHEKKSERSPITCSHCAKNFDPWKCIWCNHPIPSLMSRGIERHLHEIGLLLPGIPSHFSSADHVISDAISVGIVISTPGMAPPCANGYAAVVILEGNRFLNQPDMRSAERVREMYFSHAALARSGAHIILVHDEGHSIATELTTWNPLPAIQRELEERASLGLPPYVRAALMTMETPDITRLKSALEGARDEGRLPLSTKLLGPIPSGEKSSLILTVDIAHGDELVSTLHEFMRRRSASKKSLPSLRIDPYSLSR